MPPGRVQAVGFVQPFLWRKRGWVRVRLNIAGASTGSQGSGNESFTENVLLPVAPWPVALAIVGRVLPGVDIMAIPLVPAPERSRARRTETCCRPPSRRPRPETAPLPEWRRPQPRPDSSAWP